MQQRFQCTAFGVACEGLNGQNLDVMSLSFLNALEGCSFRALERSMYVAQAGSVGTAFNGSIGFARPGSKVYGAGGAIIFCSRGAFVRGVDGDILICEEGAEVYPCSKTVVIHVGSVDNQAFLKGQLTTGSLARKLVATKPGLSFTGNLVDDVIVVSHSRLVAGSGCLFKALNRSQYIAQAGSVGFALRGSIGLVLPGASVSSVGAGAIIFAARGSKVRAGAGDLVFHEPGAEAEHFYSPGVFSAPIELPLPTSLFDLSFDLLDLHEQKP